MPIDAAELRRLHEAATEGPWFGQYDYDGGRTVCQMRSTSETFCVNKSADVEAENPCRKTKENAELITYLRNHVTEILAALEDREEAAEDAERLRWLARTGCYIVEYPSGQEVRDCDGFIVGRGETFRAAIDAARRGGKQ